MNGEPSIRLRVNAFGRPLPLSTSRSVSMAMFGLLVAVAVVIALRRLAGALTDPLEPHLLLISGVLIAAVGVAIRLSWRMATSPDMLLGLDRLVMVGTSAATAALAFGLCLPGTSLAAMALFCTLLGIEESWAWASYFQRGEPKALASILPMDSPVSTALLHDAELPENITQQLVRSRTIDGVEELSGFVKTRFIAGQRTANVHVAFCPPFARTPELEVEQSDGPEARIKTAQLLPHGVRLDLKLAVAAQEPTDVALQFVVRSVL